MVLSTLQIIGLGAIIGTVIGLANPLDDYIRNPRRTPITQMVADCRAALAGCVAVTLPIIIMGGFIALQVWSVMHTQRERSSCLQTESVTSCDEMMRERLDR